jgi:superfamily II DNA helicase RecQ
VYTPTRKQAEEVAGELMRTFTASAYHAGLDAEHRRKVQQEFLADKIEVMIATIAFGMGIDKPNVRTVIHTALPGSLEGYYQEIGRAGRDGLPSRALLMQSYADRHTHDFFLQRDYPDVTVLDHMFAALTEQPVKKTHLQKHLKIDPDLFDKALEKLWTHGGAGVDYDENITRGEDRWRSAYLLQARQRSAQIELVIRFSSSNACRMSTLVRHFGDVADTRTACGLCDFCTPAACIAQRYRTATEEERATLFRVLAALRSRGSQSTGKLYSGLLPAAEMSRDSFENILGAMARAGLLLQADETFEKDGKRIPYRTVRLTQQGQHVDERSPISFVMKDTSGAARKTARRKKTKNTKHPTRTARATTEGKTTRKRTDKADMAVETSGLEEALRSWRLHEARRRSVPAFRIFNDQVLRSIVSDRPKSSNQLLAISGFGSNLVKQYGNQICNLVKQHASG